MNRVAGLEEMIRQEEQLYRQLLTVEQRVPRGDGPKGRSLADYGASDEGADLAAEVGRRSRGRR